MIALFMNSQQFAGKINKDLDIAAHPFAVWLTKLNIAIGLSAFSASLNGHAPFRRDGLWLGVPEPAHQIELLSCARRENPAP